MSKAPNIPTGPGLAPIKGPSKPMSPMPAASPSKTGLVKPGGSTTVSPAGQGETVDGGPKR